MKGILLTILVFMACGKAGADSYRTRVVDGGVELVMYSSDAPDGSEPKHIVVPSVMTVNSKSYAVVGIGDEAFQFQREIKSIELPDGLRYIGKNAFAYCNSLKKVVFGKNLKYLGHQAFYACDSLKEVTLPASLEDMSTAVFWNCSQLHTIHVEPGGRHLKSVNGVVLTTDGKEVVCMPHAWAGKFVVPRGVERLRDWSMVSKSLTEVTLPEGLTHIGENAFFWDVNLCSVNLPRSLRTIGEGAFVQCHALKAIDIPEGVTRLLRSTFYHCEALQSVKLPSTLTELGDDVFDDCYSLETIELPAGLTSIGTKAFSGCRELQRVRIPAATREVGDGAFGYCKRLSAIDVDLGNKNYKSVDGVLFTSDMLTLQAYPSGKGRVYVVPDGVRTIAPEAFFLSYITELTLPQSLRTIGGYAFYGCDELYDVTIPSLVESIGNDAFDQCYHLTAVHLSANIKEVGKDAFQNKAMLYVPDEALDRFLNGDISKAKANFSGIYDGAAGIRPESAHKPLARRTAADLIMKPLGQIEVEGPIWDLTAQQILAFSKNPDIDVTMQERTNNVLRTKESARFTDPSFEASFRINFSRIYTNETTGKVEMLESSISCHSYEPLMTNVITAHAKELGFTVKRDDRGSDGGVLMADKSGKTMLLVMPDKFTCNVFIVTMAPQGQYYEKVVEQMDKARK
ncbi:MAG: leucine-rich repeat domain-containing protein [Prevotella sp.]|nr:leucine-rich repeat domain-containing protein [Prevotella sp.]